MSTYRSTAAPTKPSADSANQSGTIAPSLLAATPYSRPEADHNRVTVCRGTLGSRTISKVGRFPSSVPPKHSAPGSPGCWRRAHLRDRPERVGHAAGGGSLSARRVDGVVNAAGVVAFGPLTDVDDDTV